MFMQINNSLHCHCKQCVNYYLLLNFTINFKRLASRHGQGMLTLWVSGD